MVLKLLVDVELKMGIIDDVKKQLTLAGIKTLRYETYKDAK